MDYVDLDVVGEWLNVMVQTDLPLSLIAFPRRYNRATFYRAHVY